MHPATGKDIPPHADPVFFAEGKTVLVSQHHHVLVPWCRLARETGLRHHVLTLDHHTDALPAFGRSEVKGDYDFSSDESVLRNLALLRHDEHIDWALKAGVVESSLILSQENFTAPAHPAIRISCDAVWPETQAILDGAPEAVFAAEQVLESDFLSRQIGKPQFPLILDIDLDYFLCEKALHPKDTSFFRYLIAEASLITVSLERDWQKILRLPGETLTSDSIFETLRKNFF